MLGWLPDNGSVHGVLHTVYWTSGVALVMFQVALLCTRRAATVRQRHALREAVWAVVPSLLLVWLGLLSHRTVPEVMFDRQVALESPVVSDGGVR
jgi:heme/copper-type cytochrome/quinol oxidase subunit 2